MAQRRMFASTIIDSDVFLDLPPTAQALYFHLGMRADDEGFINSPNKIQRIIGVTSDDLRLLIAHGFVILFESGVVVITHWKMHNYIRTDRIRVSVYQDERNMLVIKENQAYSLCDGQMSDMRLKSDSQMADKCQHRLGKERLGEVSIGEVMGGTGDKPPITKRFVPPSLGEIAAYCRERGNSVDHDRFLAFYESNGWKVGRNPMKDWKAAVRTWEKYEGVRSNAVQGNTGSSKQQGQRSTSKNNWGLDKFNL